MSPKNAKNLIFRQNIEQAHKTGYVPGVRRNRTWVALVTVSPLSHSSPHSYFFGL